MTYESHPDAHVLHDLSQAFDSIREHLPIPGHPERAPTLEAASHQLDDFTVLLAELSDEVGTRSVEQPQSAEQRRTVGALTSAAASAGQAVQEFTGAYEQLGFHHRFAGSADTPDLRDAREAANRVIADRLDNTRSRLQDTSRILHKRADELITGNTSRATAARVRTISRPPPHTAHSANPHPPASPSTNPAPRPGR